MPTAYVLLNCDLGAEGEIIKKIKQVLKLKLIIQRKGSNTAPVWAQMLH